MRKKIRNETFHFEPLSPYAPAHFTLPQMPYKIRVGTENGFATPEFRIEQFIGIGYPLALHTQREFVIGGQGGQCLPICHLVDGVVAVPRPTATRGQSLVTTKKKTWPISRAEPSIGRGYCLATQTKTHKQTKHKTVQKQPIGVVYGVLLIDFSGGRHFVGWAALAPRTPLSGKGRE